MTEIYGNIEKSFFSKLSKGRLPVWQKTTLFSGFFFRQPSQSVSVFLTVITLANSKYTSLKISISKIIIRRLWEEEESIKETYRRRAEFSTTHPINVSAK